MISNKSSYLKDKNTANETFCADIHHFYWQIQKKALNCAHKQTEFTNEALFSLKVSNKH